MKVRDLVAGSTFTPGAGRSGPAPRVTVILPTYRRGDDGLLRRALDSLLGQTFTDLEVIVVDDASVDSTAAVLDEVMRLDGRVSVIRHERNVGLPAVSEYEAFARARGELFVFAFDDTVFYRNAIRELVRHADRHPGTLVAGWIKVFYRHTGDGRLRSFAFGKDTTEDELLAINHIPNNGVMVPRSVLEDVGVYDPHIVLARICDYDLWLRIRRRVPITFVTTRVGEEHGPAHADSLGSTYVLDHWAADDRIRQARREVLRADGYPDTDVFDLDSFASERTRAVVRDLAERHIRTHPWMTVPVPTSPSRRVPRIMVVSAPIDATVQLVFEGLREVPDIHVRMIDPDHRYLGELAAADVLILARQVRDDWVQAAQLLGIPVFYYLDDNLPLMSAAGELEPELVRPFSLEALRTAVRPLAGVLTSTEELARSFRDQKLHTSVVALPLSVPSGAVVPRDLSVPSGAVVPRDLSVPSGAVVPRDRAHRADDAPATFAFFVGAHRLTSFRRTLWPAFVDAAQRTGRDVRVLLPRAAMAKLGGLRDKRVSLEGFATRLDYFSALRELRDAETDAIVVPPVRSVNSPFKTLHPFAAAAALGAELLAPAEEPYLGIEGEAGVTLVARGRSTASWADAIAATLERIPGAGPDPSVLERFSPERGAAALWDAVGARVPEAEPDVGRRVHQLSDWMAHQLRVTRGMLQELIEDGAGAGPAAGRPAAAAAGGVAPALLGELHATVRGSRRIHAFRGVPTPLSSFVRTAEVAGAALRRGERAELSVPLGGVPYLSYPVTIPAGSYRSVRAAIWGEGGRGDVVGIEVVDPSGRICLHTVAALPRGGEAVEVVFDARALKVPSDGTHELRVFVRGAGPAHLVEIVDRGLLGVRRPRARPLIRFVPR
ncbi:MAG: glycosyltransferase family 2 protein [Microbacteriaceae bacterium]|nr:glycosyltransferase family 2 protein [Microbacteriaceae bacterium]